ncbi:penicillin acylase family protein [Ulvibacterium sp.]|uniref:penicillin acylase family protein n=1 Tax=Ulvibacterium sp. TaxID=2665914 RepID=UPI002604C3CA|nr:penicillin acylase family protein [Ulvibacterium sp.]
MRKFKILGWTLLGILGIFILCGGIFINSLTPTYEGERQLLGLSEKVDVYYDTYGIPHIYANTEEDAFRALGFAHAQDRLWQMELLRRVGRGGLSEVFGKDLIKTDQFFLSLGIDDTTSETLSLLDMDSEMVQLSKAYLEGINQFVSKGPTPLEFYLTGLQKEPFTLRDVYNTVGYMAFSFAMAHKTDPLLTNIKDKLGPEYLKDLEINVDTSTLWIKNRKGLPVDSSENTITAMVSDALGNIALPLFEGSNSWVISPSKTKNGKVIFANDPHIGFAQPAVWYEAHVVTPTYEKYGYHMAGIPFPILGHDRQLAYGMTMFENDDVDFYFEEPHPSDSSKYRTTGGWTDYEIVSKTIKVKDSSDVSFAFRKTVHGPVLNGIADQVTGERPISMSWIYTQVENKVMHALYDMVHAANMLEFQSALTTIHAPGLNIMYGDAEGNIAWWATAKLYQIPEDVNTKLVYEPLTGMPVEKDYLDFSQNPQAINPPWNYVYSANNQPDSIAGMLYPGYYLPENRARRIVELLETKNNWDREMVAEMIMDVTSPVHPEIVDNLVKSLELKQLNSIQTKELDALVAWKGDYPLNSVEATVYTGWIYHFLKNTFADELGNELFEQVMATHFLKRLISPMAAKENSIWWDDIGTSEKVETKKEIVQKSFAQALESLEREFGSDRRNWTWNKFHTLEHGHPIGQVAIFRSLFNVGPFPVNGTREVINNMKFNFNETLRYDVLSGPSTRRIIDFSDVENSMSILPTGQSGNPFSPYYENQAEMYVKGEFRKMMMNREEIEATSKSLLTFRPTEE